MIVIKKVIKKVNKESDKESFEEEGSYDEYTVRAGCLNWCCYLKRKVKERGIDCLCCQELAALD